MATIEMIGFPTLDGRKSFKWAPLLFRPIHHSPEQLMIGIIILDGGSAHLLAGNQLHKLKCLFGDRASEAEFAASIAIEAVNVALRSRGAEAAMEFVPPVSGVAIGAYREAQGSAWQEVAERWFAASSSLFTAPQALSLVEREQISLPTSNEVGASRDADQLPQLVMDYVLNKKPDFERYFSPRILGGKAVRKRRSYEASVDYAGAKIVASFGTLFASKVSSVKTIKQRMWDLNVDKQRELSSAFRREHEMLVQYPSEGDPQVTSKQYSNIVSALDVLEREADVSEIRLRPMHTVADIGAHILRVEQAA